MVLPAGHLYGTNIESTYVGPEMRRKHSHPKGTQCCVIQINLMYKLYLDNLV